MALHIKDGTGLTSCLSVRLHHVCEHIRGFKNFPDGIDSSKQFQIYCDYVGQDVSHSLLADYLEPSSEVQSVFDFNSPGLLYDHGWNAGWYDQIHIEFLSELVALTCRPSLRVLEKSDEFKKRIGNRTAVLYRGNDKVLDIPRTPYEAMIEMAKDSGSTSFLVQTDEQEFLDEFRKHFDDVSVFDELPRIHKDLKRYVMPRISERVNFCINYLAATVAIGSAEKIITTTGNTGMWPILFRGNCQNVWQHHGEQKTWRKL